MPPSDEPIVIEPVAAPLSRGGAKTRGASRRARATAKGHRQIWRVLGFGASMLVLAGVAIYVFVALPELVEAPWLVGEPVRESVNAAPTAERTVLPDGAPPPYRSLELAQARERAQRKLDELLSAQLKLEEDMNVAAWGEADLAAVKDRATAGDQRFMDGDFAAAWGEYAGAVEDLHALVAKGGMLFDAALAAGNAALALRDQADANAAFQRAKAVRPDDPRVAAGLARAEKLPKVVAALRESERATLRGDHDAAYQFLKQAQRLDAATEGLAEMLAGVARQRAIERRKALLSNGFAALRKHDYAAALAAFDSVLRDYPNDAAALAGRQQTEQEKTLAAIDRLRDTALAQMQAEDWSAALASYDTVLGIDPSLQFARDGKERVRHLHELVQAMDRVIADAGSLSSEREFTAALQVLEQAGGETDIGSKFAERLARFRQIVQRGATPVPLVLVSDDATEITIHKIGVLGSFARRELTLRPGRYVIVGSRDGCRDVRKEIVLTADMRPVDIRCAERI